jgi:hypothetical protein
MGARGAFFSEGRFQRAEWWGINTYFGRFSAVLRGYLQRFSYFCYGFPSEEGLRSVFAEISALDYQIKC